MTRRLIEPCRWRPARLVDNGRTAPLEVVRRVATGGHGPEDVQFDGRGRVVTAWRTAVSCHSDQ